jgi:hypothetical protein
VVNKTGLTDITFSGQPTPLIVIGANSTVITNTNFVNGQVSFSADLCYNGTTTVTSEKSGNAYQWQVNTGNGIFTNISNNANYSGATSRTLKLNNVSAAFSGYQYRCIVDGAISRVFTLRFRFYWNGATSNAWENPGNWNCSVPDVYSDVHISTGQVLISSPAESRKIELKNGANLTITSGANLLVAGKE